MFENNFSPHQPAMTMIVQVFLRNIQKILQARNLCFLNLHIWDMFSVQDRSLKKKKISRKNNNFSFVFLEWPREFSMPVPWEFIEPRKKQTIFFFFCKTKICFFTLILRFLVCLPVSYTYCHGVFISDKNEKSLFRVIAK